MQGTLCSWQYSLSIQSVKGAFTVVLFVTDAILEHQVTLFIFILILKNKTWNNHLFLPMLLSIFKRKRYQQKDLRERLAQREQLFQLAHQVQLLALT